MLVKNNQSVQHSFCISASLAELNFNGFESGAFAKSLHIFL